MDPSLNSDPLRLIHLRPLSQIRRFVSSNPAFHLQPFILVSPSNAAPFLPSVHYTSPSNHQSFPTEESKIAFIITLLSGRASLWGTNVWEQKLPCCTSFQSFSEEIRKVFDRAASGREAARFLAELRQGDRSVTDFSIEFHTLAAECWWNSEAQWDMFFSWTC